MQRLARVGVLSVAKHLAVLDALLGLLGSAAGVLLACGYVIAGDMEQAVGSIVFAIFAPFLYGVFGFLVGGLMAWLYNQIAARLGGIEVELR
jgi:hypothetical protein